MCGRFIIGPRLCIQTELIPCVCPWQSEREYINPKLDGFDKICIREKVIN